ncbi:Protein of unknown function DUF538 protein [Actinidia chinensis var. chinensis]|uniref:Uncharacterized protein n=1 Tax=Actinidia chinensis var. chinensis TaxID=1590841 RepID=A0A2R6QTR5_ACTCC|nr:Protein of unknown function DUF538 protein [Actinidia chinensis var. chinensis]
MASLHNLLILFSLLFLSIIHLSLSTRPTLNLPIPSTSTADIHDLLPKYGFPRGLIPNAVKSYSLSPDGSFVIELDRACYVQFDDLVWYDKVVKGKISYGSVSDVSGIQAKKLFLWVSVTAIELNSGSDMIEFYVGALSEKLPVEQFETIPNCKNKGLQESLVESI